MIFFMPPTFKLLSGVEQIWMMVELSLHLKVEIDAYIRNRDNVHTENSMVKNISVHIKRGRILILILNILVIVIMAAISAVSAQQSTGIMDDIFKKVSWSFACLFVLEFAGISALVGILTHYLYKKKKVMHRGKSSKNFKRGICALVTIVLIFGLSFLIRVLNDFYVIDVSYADSNYRSMTYDELLGIPFDILPIMLIFCLHRKNLMAYRKHSSKANYGEYDSST